MHFHEVLDLAAFVSEKGRRVKTRFFVSPSVRLIAALCVIVFGVSQGHAQYRPAPAPPARNSPQRPAAQTAPPPAAPAIRGVNPNILMRGAQINVNVTGSSFTNTLSFGLDCGRGFPAPTIAGVKVYNQNQAVVALAVPKDTVATQCALRLGQSAAHLQITGPQPGANAGSQTPQSQRTPTPATPSVLYPNNTRSQTTPQTGSAGNATNGLHPAPSKSDTNAPSVPPSNTSRPINSGNGNPNTPAAQSTSGNSRSSSLTTVATGSGGTPVLLAVAPTNIDSGTTVYLSITGKNFKSDDRFMVDCGNASLSNVQVFSPEKAQAQLQLPDNASGACALRLGQSVLPLRITSSSADISSVSPSAVMPGSKVYLAISGKGFRSAGATSFTLKCGSDRKGQALTQIQVLSLTQASAQLTAPAQGGQQCQLWLGSSGMVPLQISNKSGQTPEISGINPGTVAPGKSATLAITGQNLLPDSSTTASTSKFSLTCGEEIPVQPTITQSSVQSATSARVSLQVPADAAGGHCQLWLGQAMVPFDVSGKINKTAMPSLVAVTPSSVDAGTTVYLSITGKNFKSEDHFTVDCGQASLSNIQVSSPQKAQAQLQLPEDASGACALRLGQSVLPLQIAGLSAEISSVSPSTVIPGAKVYVAITGKGFRSSGASAGNQATSFTLKCANDKTSVALTEIQVLSATQAQGQLIVPAAFTNKQCQVWLGSKGMAPLQIGKPGDSTSEISGITPERVAPGTKTTLNITGHNLPTKNAQFRLACGEETVALPTISQSSVQNATTASVTLQVPKDARGGKCQLWLGQAMAPFDVGGKAGAQSLVAVAPNSIDPGTSVYLSITGKDFKSDDRFMVDCGNASLSDVQVTSAEKAQAKLQLPQDASGTCALRLGTSTLPLRITGGAAEITSVSPSTVAPGSKTYLAMSGNGFHSASGSKTNASARDTFRLVCGSKDIVAVTEIIILSTTQAEGQVTVPSPLAGKQCELWLGSSGMVPLQIASKSDQMPAISGINPASIIPGGKATLNITGHNLPTKNAQFSLTCGEDTPELPTIFQSNLQSGTAASVTLQVPKDAAGGKCQLWLGQAMAPFDIAR